MILKQSLTRLFRSKYLFTFNLRLILILFHQKVFLLATVRKQVFVSCIFTEFSIWNLCHFPASKMSSSFLIQQYSRNCFIAGNRRSNRETKTDNLETKETRWIKVQDIDSCVQETVKLSQGSTGSRCLICQGHYVKRSDSVTSSYTYIYRVNLVSDSL